MVAKIIDWLPPPSVCNKDIHDRPHDSLLLDRILSQIKPVHNVARIS
jgi:hypothetical protein